MEQIRLSQSINAPVKKVWDTMLEDKTYREWTNEFSDGSYYKGTWDKGSEIYFLGTDPDTGLESGMISRIQESTPYSYIAIEHLGVYKNGVEDLNSELSKEWKGALETYTFNEKDEGTELIVIVDVTQEEKENMEILWKKALAKLKEMCERE